MNEIFFYLNLTHLIYLLNDEVYLFPNSSPLHNERRSQSNNQNQIIFCYHPLKEYFLEY